MATATWASIHLCERADIDMLVRDLEIPLWDADDSTADARLEKVFSLVKDDFAERLQERLPEVFVNTINDLTGWNMSWDSWLVQQNLTYDQLEAVLDKIQNPSILKWPAAILSIVYMLDNGTMKLTASQNLMADVIQRESERWMKKFIDRFERCFKQLKLDLNQDGKISDFERVRTHKSLMRA